MMCFCFDQTYIQECDRLKSRLLEEELSSSRLRKEVEFLSKEIETKSMKLDQQMNVLISDKVGQKLKRNSNF